MAGTATLTSAPPELESRTTGERVLAPALEAQDAKLRFSGVGMLKAEEVELENSAAGIVVAGREAKLERAGARTIIVAGPVDIKQGGAGQLLSLGDVRIEQGGAAVVAARSATISEGGFVGLAVTPRLRLEPGARLLAGPREVALLAVVAAVAASLSALVVALASRRSAASQPSQQS
jgi:hypothetical protein